MNYKDLLQTQEWKNKREFILERDNHTCRRCGNCSSLHMQTFVGLMPSDDEDFLKDILISKSSNFNTNIATLNCFTDVGQVIAKTPLKTGSISNDEKLVLILNLVFKRNITYPFNGSTIGNLNENILINGNTNKIFFDIGLECNHEIDVQKMEFDKEGIWLTYEKNANEFIKSKYLHVHHLCYREDKMIWSQDDDEYMTLCNVCHAIIHNNQMIPYYDEFGNIYQYMHPCWKCGGRRYLDCYRHVDNGICYGCNGTGQNTTTSAGLPTSAGL